MKVRKTKDCSINNVTVVPPADVSEGLNRSEDWEFPEVEHNKLTQWNWLIQYPEHLRVGKNIDIGAFTYINCKWGIVIEDYVEIGSHCSIYSVSTIDNKSGKVILKKNVKIGSHSIVMPNVTIGKNSVIGAFSFVNKNIPAGVLAFGIPCKVIKKIK